MACPPLITPEQLSQACVLLDAGRSPEAFAQGHLPGALHADLERHLSQACVPGADPARGGRHPLPEPAQWARQLGSWGITEASWVVVYDDAAGGKGAARLWWMLKAFGHERVSLLDGGLQGALEAGLTLSTAATQAAPAPPYPGDRWLWPTVDLARVDRLRQDPAWKVLDVRAEERYAGRSEPLDPAAGHIPGALNRFFGENLDTHGRFLPPAVLRARYADLLAGTPPERLAVHCGSGVTACHTLLALELAGLQGAALYVGSWSEWCRNPLPQAKA